MRISDWSSDVCSSDLRARSATVPDRRRDRRLWQGRQPRLLVAPGGAQTRPWRAGRGDRAAFLRLRPARSRRQKPCQFGNLETGRTSCRERGGPSGKISEVSDPLKKKKNLTYTT